MKVSINIIVKNEADCIKKCLEALLNQSYQGFEIIIVDNGSTDGTKEIIKSFSDTRIKYFYERSNFGIAELRNIAVKKSTGEYIFFTDGDCVPEKHWLEEGLSILETKEYVGVEGKTYYETKAKATIRDTNVCQFAAGEFMTCNTAYISDVIKKVGYFDAHFKYGTEDIDLALRIMKQGRICFSPDILVSHQRKKITLKTLFQRSKRVEDLVRLIKKHGWNEQSKYAWQQWKAGKILYPKQLLCIICPPLLILIERYASLNDLIFGFFKYISYIYGRILIWKAAIKNRIFVI